MEDVRTIKGIDRELWLKFKELAAKKGMNMGALFKEMVKEYEKKADDFWDKILHGEKTLSDNEAKEMNDLVDKMRKEKGFRNESGL